MNFSSLLTLFSNRRYIIVIFLIVTLISIQTIGFVNSEESEKKLLEKSNSRISENSAFSSKIDQKVIEILQNNNPSNMAKYFGTSYIDDEVFVYVYLDSASSKLPNDIQVLAKSDNISVTKLNLSQLIEIANYDNVKKITLPKKLNPLEHAHSEGVESSFADQMQAAGFTGNGVRVAVIDLNFFTSNSEIASNVVFSQLFDSTSQCGGSMTCGVSAGESHGTAVAEIVVDMAPNVDLFLYTTVNSVDLNNAITDAISRNVDIITISLGVDTAGGDGVSGFYRDGTSSVAKKVNEAKNNGILVTTSAGNSAEEHWSGTYSISPVPPANLGLGYESVMNFNPSAAGNMRACLPVTDLGGLYIATWNDWDASNQDYDFFLYDSTMTTNLFTVLFINGLGGSIGPQTGIQEPIEAFFWIGEGSACLVLASFSSTENHFFHILTGGNGLNSNFQVPSGSLSTPADASGALTVGAVHHSTDILETFSSQGPTDDSRNKPEICGPDNTLSHQTSGGFSPGIFPGTSAAVPHVAGAAALLIEQTPGITVDQLRHRLTDEARFNVSYSVNNLCGSNSGAVSLQTASTTDVYIPLGVGVPGCEVGSLCYLPSTLAVATGTQVTWYNGDTAAHTVTSGTPGGGPDGIFDSGLLLSGESFSHTFQSKRTVNYFCLVHPWMTGQVTVTSIPCSPPGSGDWIITSSCTLTSSATAPGDVIIQNGAVLTILPGRSLDIDFANNFLKIKSGSGILIRSGGSLT